jgi:hypothetical protein
MMLFADNSSHYASHPKPVTDYAEAVQRVENLRAKEVGFNPDCHTFLLTHGSKTAKAIVFVPGYGSSPPAFKELGPHFYDRGYNVLSAPLPYNGLADRLISGRRPTPASSPGIGRTQRTAEESVSRAGRSGPHP